MDTIFFSIRQIVLLLVLTAFLLRTSAAATELVSNATSMICSFKRSVCLEFPLKTGIFRRKLYGYTLDYSRTYALSAFESQPVFPELGGHGSFSHNGNVHWKTGDHNRGILPFPLLSARECKKYHRLSYG